MDQEKSQCAPPMKKTDMTDYIQTSFLKRSLSIKGPQPFKPTGIFGILKQGVGLRHQMAAIGGRAYRNMSGSEVRHKSNHNSSVFQAEALLNRTSFKMGVI